MANTYTRKSSTIEAMPFLHEDDAPEIIKWVRTNGGKITMSSYDHPSRAMMVVETPSGLADVVLGNVVCKGAVLEGDFYPCDGPTFEATYDLLDK